MHVFVSVHLPSPIQYLQDLLAKPKAGRPTHDKDDVSFNPLSSFVSAETTKTSASQSTQICYLWYPK